MGLCQQNHHQCKRQLNTNAHWALQPCCTGSGGGIAEQSLRKYHSSTLHKLKGGNTPDDCAIDHRLGIDKACVNAQCCFPLPDMQSEQRTRSLRFCCQVCGTHQSTRQKESPTCDVKQFDVNSIQFHALNYIQQLPASQVHSWWPTVNIGITQDRAGAFAPNLHESKEYKQ